MANRNITLKRNNAGTTEELYPTTDWAQVNNKPSTFAPTSHEHDIDEINGLIESNSFSGTYSPIFYIGNDNRLFTKSGGITFTGSTNTLAVAGNVTVGGNSVATLASPALTGTPTAPTAAANTNSTQIATTAYVQGEITDLIGGAPGALDTLNELAAAINDDSSFASTVTTNLAGKLNLTGGTLTGTLTSRSINMQNYTLSNVGQMTFNDPGPNEGISWSGGNFSIYESPNDLSTNSSGNLQFVSGGSRRLTVQTDGTVYAPGAIQSNDSVVTPEVQMTSNPARNKIRVWSGGTYGIGMTSGFTYGGLGATGGEYAMTFQMNDDDDRGFWWGDSVHTGAQGAMALTTAGQLTVADKIRVGYGQSDTTTPATYAVDANGDIQISNSNPVLRLNDTGTTTGDAYIDYQAGTSLKIHAGGDAITFIAGNSEKARLTAGNGFLGIGTTNPQASLHIVETSAGVDLAKFRNDGDTGDVTIKTSGEVGIVKGGAGDQLQLSANGTDNNGIRITTAGNVGIGTTSPAEKLHIDGGSIYVVDDGGNPRVVLGDNLSSGGYGQIQWNSSTDVLQLGSSLDTDSLAITESGNVGIGTASPTQKLEVSGNINGNELHLNDTNTILKEASSGNSVRIQTDSGYVDVGPKNTGWSHFDTDRGRFYFNKGVDTNGDLRMYSNNTTKIENSTGYIYELGNRVLTTASTINAATADKWTTARTLSLTGDVTGSVSWDGSGNASLATTISGGGGYTHPTHPGDDISIDTGALTGATVISDLDFNVTSDTQGHITDANATVSTRELTASDIGAAASSHSHGNLSSTGGWTGSPQTIAGGDYLIIGDASNSSKLSLSNTQFGTSTTEFLRRDGTWAAPEGSEYEWQYVTKVTGATTLTYSSMSPSDYEYKFVVEVQTTGEDTSNPYIRINADSTSNEYSYQYQSVTQTAETTETVLNAGDAATTLIYTGADLSSYSFGGTNGSTIHRAEFIYSVNPQSAYPGNYSATVRGWAHTHWVSTTGTSYDGMVQSTYVGTKDNILLTEANRIDYTHSINNGGNDSHEMRVYRRARK